MKISIIVPCYNVELYLANCLDSILNQSFPDFEVICVEDCSTDNTLSILNKYQESHPDKIVVLQHQQNLGLGGARNTGTLASKGDYLFFVDSDDELKIDALEMMYNAIARKSPLAEMCVAYAERKYLFSVDETQKKKSPLIRAVSDLKRSFFRFSRKILSMQNKSWNIDLMKQPKFIRTEMWGKLYKKDFYLKNIYPVKDVLAEDLVASVQENLTAKSAIFLDKTVYTYYIRPNSITTMDKKAKIDAENMMKIHRYNYQHVQQHRPKNYKKYFLNTINQSEKLYEKGPHHHLFNKFIKEVGYKRWEIVMYPTVDQASYLYEVLYKPNKIEMMFVDLFIVCSHSIKNIAEMFRKNKILCECTYTNK